MDEETSSLVNFGFNLYEWFMPIIVAAFSWLGLRMVSYLKTQTKNELIFGMASRLNDSVFEAVKDVNERMKELIGKAKDPASPGGIEITKGEAEVLKTAALDHVKTYWGKKGMKELGKVLGFGGLLGFGKPDNHGLESMIINKINAAVNDVKAASRNPK